MRLLLAAVVAAVSALFAAWLPLAAPAAAAPGAGSVTITALQVSPSTPQTSTSAQPLTITLQLTNTTMAVFRKLTITGVRGNPISNQSALDEAIAKPGPPDPAQAATITTAHPVTTALGPHQTTQLDFTTTTSKPPTAAGICLCQNRIYPLYFEVIATHKDGTQVVLGSTQTFLPYLGASQPQPVQVSWVWPLLEPPHRTTSVSLFTDDSLAASVAGGRLDRLLATVEDVVAQDPKFSMTLLVDPDLIDELAVMAAGSYQVRVSGGHTTPGTGTTVARAWLGRLRGVLSTDSNLQLAFTPYADPDVRSLAANGIGWSQQADTAAQARINSAIGGHRADIDISWPLDSSLNGQTLSALLRTGVDTVIVNDKSVPGSTRQSPAPDALTPLTTSAGTALAAITSSPIERYVTRVVSSGGDGMQALPELVAEVAIRAAQDGNNSHYVVITPPRNVDPDPTAAGAAMLDTAHTSWSTALSLGAATAQIAPVKQGALHEQPLQTPLPSSTIEAARYLTGSLPSAVSLLTDPTHPSASTRDIEAGAAAGDTATLLEELPAGLQRAESAEWADTPATGAKIATSLQSQVQGFLGGVRLIHPTTGTYTLGSSDSPLPVTIENTLDVPVFVRLHVAAVGGLPGFSAGDVGVQQVGPGSRLAVRIPAHVDRAGRIRVRVELTTPGGQRLGTPLELSVRTTAFGEIGKIITFVAGGILALALLIRLLRALRRWRHHGGGEPAAPAPRPVPAGTSP